MQDNAQFPFFYGLGCASYGQIAHIAGGIPDALGHFFAHAFFVMQGVVDCAA